MTKVLLVYANSFMDNLIPLGVSILSACLKKANHKVALFDTTFYRTRERPPDETRFVTLQVRETHLEEYGIHEKKADMIDDFRLLIDKFEPDLIGVSVVETTYLIGLELLNGIKDYKIPKIMGGIHVTMCPEEVIKEEAIDMICVGEGETAIVELANKIGKKQDYTDVNNLWIKKEGNIIQNLLNPLVNLDDIPMQDWTIYEKKRFYKPMGGKVWICGIMELDRGCHFRCTYCCNAKLQDMYKGLGKYPRERSIESFIKELKIKKKRYNLKYLYLVAENFLYMNKDRFDKFIRMYKHIKLPFWVESRPETITMDRLKRLKSVGCEGISIGVEQGNEKFRRTILGRFIPNERIIKAFKIANRSGLRVSANSIIGFPTETRKLVFDTIELNRKLKAHNCMINIFCAHRGTVLRKMCIEKGYISEKMIIGDYRCDSQLNMPQLGKEEIRGLQRTFGMYIHFPKKMWRRIRKAEKFTQEGNAVFKELSDLYKRKFMKSLAKARGSSHKWNNHTQHP